MEKCANKLNERRVLVTQNCQQQDSFVNVYRAEGRKEDRAKNIMNIFKVKVGFAPEMQPCKLNLNRRLE